jgi:hypothetical protein
MSAFRRVTIASPHRYPDLARLWYRVVREVAVPALERAGLKVEVALYRDANVDQFRPDDFPGARLEEPGPGQRDFVEFYDAALARESDLILFLDADLFVFDDPWLVSGLRDLEAPGVAAVSYLRRGRLPGVYALLCRGEIFRQLPAPVMAAGYDDLDHWPESVNRGPGERAAIELERRGLAIIDRNSESEGRLADFHGTTVIRASRDQFAAAIGEAAFEALVGDKRYFAMGAYDNLLLARLYRAAFGAPFACGPDGAELTGSLTEEALRRALAQVRRPELQATLRDYFARSNRAALLLARHLAVALALPEVQPASWSAHA